MSLAVTAVMAATVIPAGDIEALGARRTITVNRLGGVGGFTEAVTRLLNASGDGVDALYSATDPTSSFYIGLDEATGVFGYPNVGPDFDIAGCTPGTAV